MQPSDENQPEMEIYQRTIHEINDTTVQYGDGEQWDSGVQWPISSTTTVVLAPFNSTGFQITDQSNGKVITFTEFNIQDENRQAARRWLEDEGYHRTS